MALLIGFVIAVLGTLVFASSPVPDWLLRASEVPANQLQSRNMRYVAICFFLLLVAATFLAILIMRVNSAPNGSRDGVRESWSQEQAERERQARLERENLARLEHERSERERQASLERERLERLDREHQASLERDRLARLEQERLERERQARLEQERQERERRREEELQEAASQATRAVRSYYDALDKGRVDEAVSAWYSHEHPDSLRRAIKRIADAQVVAIELTRPFSSDSETATVRITVKVRNQGEEIWTTWQGPIELRRWAGAWKIETLSGLTKVY